jgi:hypothetical protein
MAMLPSTLRRPVAHVDSTIILGHAMGVQLAVCARKTIAIALRWQKQPVLL